MRITPPRGPVTRALLSASASPPFICIAVQVHFRQLTTVAAVVVAAVHLCGAVTTTALGEGDAQLLDAFEAGFVRSYPKFVETLATEPAYRCVSGSSL